MADVLWIVAGVAMLAVASLAIASVIGAVERATFVVAALVVGAATVVVESIAVSAVGAYTRTGLLVAGVVVTGATVAVWARAGRPRPPRWHWRPGTVGVAVRRRPLVAALVVIAGLALAVQFVVALAFPPSNYDSMTYHLSRAAYWLQYDSATPFPGGSVRQLDSPPNAELLQGWTLAVAGTDRFAALVQWLALVGTACCVYLAARLLAFGRAAAVFAAALFVVLPQPLLQATTTQNDLIVAFFVAATCVFGVRGLRDRRTGDLAVFVLAAGLAVGTKGTVLALAPSLAIILGYELWRARPPRPLVMRTAAGLLAAVVVLGSWGYAHNVARGESPLGGLAAKTQRTGPVVENGVRVLWTFVDSPGVRVPLLDTAFPRAAHKIGERFEGEGYRYHVDTSVSEDTSSYGIVGWLLLAPLLLFFALRRGGGARQAWAIAALLGLVSFAVTIEFNAWVGRLMLPIVALAAPLFAALAARWWLAALAVVAAVAVMWPVLTGNENKRLLPSAASMVHRDRIAQMTQVNPQMDPVLRAVTADIGTRGTLVFVGHEDAWDYPFFGARRERRVVRRTPDDMPRDMAALRALGARAALYVGATPARELNAQLILPGYWYVKVA